MMRLFAFTTVIAAVMAAPAVAVTPSRTAAIVALKQKVAAATGHKVWRYGAVTCITPGGSGEVWKCDFPAGRSTISFDSRRDFKVTVWLLCKPTAPASLRPAC